MQNNKGRVARVHARFYTQLCVWDWNTVNDMKDQRKHMDGWR